MNTLPFPTYELSEDNVESILEIYNKLKISLSAEFDFDLTLNFKNFELFRYYESYHIGPVVRFQNNSAIFYTAFIQVAYKATYANKFVHPPIKEYQTWGVAFLKSNFGHILIKPETLLDKIHDLIKPIELEFEDEKEFSNRFQVVTKDKLKANLQMTPTFRNHIQNIQTKDFVIEIIHNTLIIGNKKVIKTGSARDFIEFLAKVSKSL